MTSLKRTLTDGTVSIKLIDLLNQHVELITPLLESYTLPRLSSWEVTDNGKPQTLDQLFRYRGDALTRWDDGECSLSSQVLNVYTSSMHSIYAVTHRSYTPLLQIPESIAAGGWMYQVGLNRDAMWVVVQISYPVKTPKYSFGHITAIAIDEVSPERLLEETNIRPTELAGGIRRHIAEWLEKAQRRYEDVHRIDSILTAQAELFNLPR